MTDDRPYRGDEYEYDSFRTCGGTWRVDGTPPPLIGVCSLDRKRDPRICGFCTRATMEPRDGQGICARCGFNAGTFGYEELMRMRA
jgi:hypothetical protein